MNKLSTLLAAALLALCPALFHGCQNTDGGTEIPNELTGKVRLSDGGAVVNAQVKLYPAGYVPGDTGDILPQVVYTAASGAGGIYAFKDVPAGVYNIHLAKEGLRAYRDSVAVTGKAQDLPADTLREPGSLTGYVALQPDHPLRTAVVQVTGSPVYVNVEKDGHFTLPDLAPGRYRLRAHTTLEKYTPAFREVTVRSGMSDTLAEPLVPFYSGVPVLLGLAAMPGPNGTVTLRWNQPDYDKVDGYIIYRDSAGTLLPAREPYARVNDTLWVDTVYSHTPRAGQHAYRDTLYHSYTYRVAVLDKSGQVGPVFESIEAKAVPPSFSFVSGLWKRALVAAPFGRRSDHSLVVHNDRLWMLGAKQDDTVPDIWSSPDGISWRMEVERAPFQTGSLRSVAFQDKLWVLAGGFYSSESGSGMRSEVWNSVDGVAWSKVTDAPAFSARAEAQFLVHGDLLVVMSGHGSGGSSSGSFSDVWTSKDGVTWSRVDSAPVSIPYGTAATSFLGQIWILGGGIYPVDYNTSILASPSGAAFMSHASPPGLLPRTNHGLTVHSGRIWIAGGRVGAAASFFDDVWNSPDGKAWTLIDSHAPFGSRVRPAMASFQGKLWISGGDQAGTAAEIWYLSE